MRPAPNEQQRAATEAHGTVFVAAGAGTGKTAVLVERFVRAVVDDGLDVDSVLVITYTERAAGELRARIRASLIERGRPDLALELDGAWVSTIHGFCRRLLGAHPLAAGIDPGFRVLDESQALVLQAEAFTAALEAFCAADEPDRWQLLATYGADGLRRMLVEVYATLRSAGRELVLEPGPRAGLGERVDGVREAADVPRRRHQARPSCSATPAQAALDLLGDVDAPRAAPRARRAQGARPSRGELRGGARRRRRGGARGARRQGPRASPGAAHDLRGRLRGREGPRVRARLRGPPAPRPRSPREPPGDQGARAAAVPLDHGRRVPGHEPPADGASRPARADRGRRPLRRRRRVPVDLRVPSRRRGGVPRAARGSVHRPPADPEPPLASRGARGRERALRGRVRRRVPAPRAGGGVRPARAPERRRAPRHGQGSGRRDGRPLAPLRGPSRRPSRPGARRRRRRDAGADRPPLRRRHRRRVVRGGARAPSTCRPIVPPAAATSASSRSSTSSRTCASSATATTTRRCSPCSRRRSSASRTTRSS